MVKKIIGISGVARAGKDTFASILMKQLTKKNKSVVKFALADALKGDCDEFCKKYFGFSAYTQITEEKNLIRPFLVWYGDAQRKRTNGTYWINIVQEKLEKIDTDFAIITDIRYAHYPKDEIQWVHELGGLVVHVARFKNSSMESGIENRQFVQPANDHETVNDPKVRALASYSVEWEHINSEDLLRSEYLSEHVSKFVEITGLIQ